MVTTRTLKQRALFAVASLLLAGSQSAYGQNVSSAEAPGEIVPAQVAPADIPFKIPTVMDTVLLPKLTVKQQEIYDVHKSGDCGAAKKLIQEELKKGPGKAERRELLSLAACLDLQLDDPKSALESLSSILETSANEPARVRATILKRMGDAYLKMRKHEDAIAKYKEALKMAETLEANDVLRIGILEPLVGCYSQDKLYKEAQPYAEQLVEVSRLRSASNNLIDVGPLFWSEIQLARIYKHTDNPDKYEKLVSRAMPLVDQLLTLRAKFEGKTIEEEEERYCKFQTAMLQSYIAQNNPATLSEYMWLSSQFRMRSLPLITWQPAVNTGNGTAPKAVILCVHALGLESRAFGPFAKKMIAKNFAVYAMDVRGFGAWQAEYGSETVSFDRAIEDIAAILRVIKKRQPGLPVFLLGESMGGAMVLRAASEFGDEMAGVISSVPSAERQGGVKMAVNVAFNFFKGPNKPIDIGTGIAAQATSKVELRDAWKNDPRARGDLSPIELIKFDLFMKETRKRCALIRTTPIMVVQGMADKLVRPEGTYEMYHNVNSPDKTMIIIGNAEHLILETPNQSKVLLDGLTAWLDNHQTAATPSSQTPSAQTP
ncbi:MAG: alpha/beta fold hydrolase [Leptolyngbya sp.]|nr:alpha/beta fold hydrolase [Candidatus Melainabacteria bacterium]